MFKRRQSSAKAGKQVSPSALEEGYGRLREANDSGYGVFSCMQESTGVKNDTTGPACRSTQADGAPRNRYKDPLGWLMFALLMGWRPMELLPLPSWFRNAALIAGNVYTP